MRTLTKMIVGGVNHTNLLEVDLPQGEFLEMAVVVTAHPSEAGPAADLLRILACISLVCGCHAVSSCLRDPAIVCGNCTAGPEYDLSNNCSTCVEPRLDPTAGCTDCMEGEAQCYTGHFTFSVLFHSYMNPQHLCGECVETGPACCDTVNRTDNCSNICHLRQVLSVQPYRATALDVELPQGVLFDHPSDNVTMFEQGPAAFPRLNDSNPYTVELDTWTERLQFYIVVYDFYGPSFTTGQRRAIDRFLINLGLGAVPNAIPRQTYHGIHNIAQFDLSFDIQCSENYYGPQCSIFCSEIGVYTCDAMGNRICADPSCDIGSSSSGILGGVIGAIVAVILILILLAILIFMVCRQRKLKYKTGKCQVATSKTKTFNARDKLEIKTEEYKAYAEVSNVNPAEELEDCAAYAQTSTVDPAVEMEECVAYGQTSTVDAAEELEDCAAYGQTSTIDPAVKMEECVAYGHVSTLEHSSQGLLPATTEKNHYDYIDD